MARPLGGGSCKRGVEILSRESLSASRLIFPGMCLGTIVKLCLASIRNKQCSRRIRLSSLQYLALMMSTTAWLSQRALTWQFSHSLPHAIPAIIMGMSSRTAIEWVFAVCGHCSWNQWVPQKAPHPQEPDASDVIVTVGVAFPSDDSNEIPFQSFKKVCHHMRSDLKLLFRRM